jgi:hypothetical protein
MPTLILSTVALLGCALLIYAFFHWLREELNPPPTRKGSWRKRVGKRRRLVARESRRRHA